MIPKPLSEITWNDLELLKESGREEDDSIEFKEAFSGGDDFTILTESQRARAVDAVAREVIAFLNSRGGDVLIGVRERKNDHPVIEELTPVRAAAASADRLAQSLAALIEPSQALVQTRAIVRDSGDVGVIVVRAPSSLRAPHRSNRSKECYVRRGKESVPMPMEEIQDLVVRRTSTRRERERSLADLAKVVREDRLGRDELSPQRIHLRLIYVPLSVKPISLEVALLAKLGGFDPVIIRGEHKTQNDVAFRGLHGSWKPLLRGRISSSLDRYGDDEHYAAKAIFEDGTLVADVSFKHSFVPQREFLSCHYEWLLGFLANGLISFRNVITGSDIGSNGLLTLSYRFDGDAQLMFGKGVFSDTFDVPEQTGAVPTFEIVDAEQLRNVFRQLQIDLCALAGVDERSPFEWAEGQ